MSETPTAPQTPKAPKAIIPQKKSILAWFNEQMTYIHSKTGFNGIYVVLIVIISLFLIYFNIFDKTITKLIGTAYPSFWTIKSIESNSDEKRRWLTYWVIFGMFSLVDLFSPIIVKFVPFYFIIKNAFLLYLIFGQGGCELVYNLLVKRIISQYEEVIDKYAENVNENLNEYVFNDENKKAIKNFKKGIRKKFQSVIGGLTAKEAMEDAIKAAQSMEGLENNEKEEDAEAKKKSN